MSHTDLKTISRPYCLLFQLCSRESCSYTHLSVFFLLVLHFLLFRCLCVWPVAWHLASGGGGDVAWSMTTLYDPAGSASCHISVVHSVASRI